MSDTAPAPTPAPAPLPVPAPHPTPVPAPQPLAPGWLAPWQHYRLALIFVLVLCASIAVVVAWDAGWLHWPWSVPAQTLALDPTYAADPNEPTAIVAHGSAGRKLFWHFPDNVKYLTSSDGAVIVWAKTPGQYRIHVSSAPARDTLHTATTHLVVAGPLPPVPPGPGPGPTPPVPPPTPAPINADGLHVLILYDDAARDKLTQGQFDALYSQAFRDNLNAKCAADGQQKAWRIWASKVSPSAEAKKWQDAFARPHATLPWLVVSNPQKGGGFEGPLPQNLTDTQALVAKFGG